MVDTSAIHVLISRARRRLRVQAALDGATTASIPAVGAAVAVVYAVRTDTLGERIGIFLLVACIAIIALGAVLGALRRFPTHIVATRIDRASNLADRLSSACAFERLLARKQAGAPGMDAAATPDTGAAGPRGSNDGSNDGSPGFSETNSDDQTEALMRAAIRDAVHAAPRANVAAATPFTRPRDTSAAAVFAAVSLLVGGLYWPTADDAANLGAALPALQDPAARAEAAFPLDPLDPEDIDYARDLLSDLMRVAKDEQEPSLEEFTRKIEELLARAELGELSKEELLAELAKAEQRYMQGADEDMEESLADLQETGRELNKNPLSRELGQALEKGDLGKAQEEMEKLAQKLENQKLSEKEREELARALEKAAEKFQKKDAERDDKMDKQIEAKKDQIRKLRRKQEETKDEQEKQRLTRKLDKEKRELKELERDKEKREQSAQRRNLKQLHRNLDQASRELKQEQKKAGQQEDQKDGRKAQRMASRSLERAAKDTGNVDADRRKMAAQKKVASQLGDLKEAMRRARRGNKSGMNDLFGKNRKNEDFRRRARGQQGSRTVWRPGQKPGRAPGQGPGQGQQGQQPGGKGRQPGGDSYGDEHDPYLMGDPTAKSGNTKDESVSGVHGRGPSRRETILAAAQKGFAARGYKQVYADYKNIVEEVMRAEKVPSGYKYYVKRYFDKIKPEQ